VIRRLHPDCFYWPGSPFGGNDHNSQQAGDRHNWQTWHALADRRFGEKPKTIDDFDDKAAAVSYWHLGADQGRFISEFGIHASPVYETLRRNIPAGDLAYGSPGLAFRNRNIIRDRGDLMMQAHTGLPGSLDDYIDFSMMTQAEGLKYGIEHFRRRKFHCSGALFWQWNDNWPSITWSVLDYYRFPKAGYFYVKRAFAPVMLSIARDAGGGLSVHGVNDTLEPVGDVLEWRHVRFNGEVIAQSRLSFTLAANAAAVLHRFASGQFDDARPDEMLWLGSTNGHFPDNRWFFAPELKHLRRARPDVYVDWKREGGALLATLSAQEHAYFVNLTVPVQGVRYTDNWIDLYPGHSRELTLWHPDGREIDPAQVTVRWR
jgi:beta-mannosidase